MNNEDISHIRDLLFSLSKSIIYNNENKTKVTVQFDINQELLECYRYIAKKENKTIDEMMSHAASTSLREWVVNRVTDLKDTSSNKDIGDIIDTSPNNIGAITDKLSELKDVTNKIESLGEKFQQFEKIFEGISNEGMGSKKK